VEGDGAWLFEEIPEEADIVRSLELTKLHFHNYYDPCWPIWGLTS